MKRRTGIGILAIVNVIFLVGIIYNLVQYSTDKKVLDWYISDAQVTRRYK